MGKIKKKSGVGRPKAEMTGYITKIKPFLMRGLTIAEACREARVPSSTIYDYMKKSEEIRHEIESYENYASTVAETNIVDTILKEKNIDNSKWWLERRKRDKYATKQEIDQMAPTQVTIIHNAPGSKK